MKRFTAFIVCCLLVASLAGQNTLTVASETKDAFWLYLDGVLQNPIPTQSLRVFQIPSGNYNIKIIINNIEKNKVNGRLQIHNGENNYYITNYTPNKHKYFLRPIYYGMLRISMQVPFSAKPTLPLHPQENAHLNPPMPPFNDGLHGVPPMEQLPPVIPPRPVCSAQHFNQIRILVEQKNFENEKLETAKHHLSEEMMTARQITELANLLNFENTRLELLKFAYPFCYDKVNYNLTFSTLKFKSSREDLKQYIEHWRLH